MKIVIYILLLYLFLYNPFPTFLGGIGGVKIIYLFLIFFFLKDKEIRKRISDYKPVIIAFIALFFYSIILGLFGYGAAAARSAVVAFIESLLIPLFFVRYKESYLNNMGYVAIISYTGAIAAIITIAALFMPSFNLFVNTYLQIPSEVQKMVLYRGFGLSGELTFGYGMVQGIIAGWILLNGRKTPELLFFLIPMLLFSALMNARTGVLVGGVAFVIYIVKPPFKLLNKLIMAIITIIGVYIALNLIGQLSYETQYFVEQFVYEVQDAIFGTSNAKNATAADLTGDLFFLPETISGLVFGEGIDVFSQSVAKRSDVGYVRDIMLGGLVYLLLKFNVALQFFRIAYNNKALKWLLLFFCAAIAMGHLKGEFLISSGGFRLMSLILVIEIELLKQRNATDTIG